MNMKKIIELAECLNNLTRHGLISVIYDHEPEIILILNDESFFTAYLHNTTDLTTCTLLVCMYSVCV